MYGLNSATQADKNGKIKFFFGDKGKYKSEQKYRIYSFF